MSISSWRSMAQEIAWRTSLTSEGPAAAVQEEGEVAHRRGPFEHERIRHLLDDRRVAHHAELHLFGLQRGQHGLLFGHDPDRHAVDERAVAPVVGERGELELLALLPRAERERPGPVGLVGDGAGLDGRGRHDRRVEIAQRRRERCVGGRQGHHDGQVVGRRDALDRQQVGPHDRAGGLVEDPLQRGDDIRRCQRGAVVERDAFAQIHGQLGAVVVVGPVGGQGRYDVEVGVELSQRVVDQLEGIDRLERGGEMRVEVVDVAGAPDDDRAAGRLRCLTALAGRAGFGVGATGVAAALGGGSATGCRRAGVAAGVVVVTGRARREQHADGESRRGEHRERRSMPLDPHDNVLLLRRSAVVWTSGLDHPMLIGQCGS